jgi:hypothetical protein
VTDSWHVVEFHDGGVEQFTKVAEVLGDGLLNRLRKMGNLAEQAQATRRRGDVLGLKSHGGDDRPAIR